VYLNKADAVRLGVQDGDVVRVVSPTFGGDFDVAPGQKQRVEGKIKAIAGLRPGTVAISWHYGHWAYGASDVVIDGQRIPGDPTRARGLVANPAVLVDAYLKDVCLTDPVAGDSVFNGTNVKLVKVAAGTNRGMPRAGVSERRSQNELGPTRGRRPRRVNRRGSVEGNPRTKTI